MKNASAAPIASPASASSQSSIDPISASVPTMPTIAADEVGSEHHRASRQAVGDDSSDQQEAQQPDRERAGDQRELDRAAAELDHLKGDRDQPDPVAGERDRKRREQQPVVAVAEWPQGGRERGHGDR